MARPHGFDHFFNYLKGLENQYVIIGGGAASILMDDEGLDFRATKDVDLVVLSRSKELNKRILSYVEMGKYKTKEATKGTPRYYRFQRLEDANCPKMIELFARNELGLELGDSQYIIPIQDENTERISAILLDDEYFKLIQKNITKSLSEIPLINPLGNICLKARAHRELFERRAAGDITAEEKAIQKHLKDIWRLAVILTGEEVISLSGKPLEDLEAAINKLDHLPESQYKQVMEGMPNIKKSDMMDTLKKIFLKT